MLVPRGIRIALRVATALTLAFIYVPIAIIVLYSFNATRVASWPIQGLRSTGTSGRSRTRASGTP
jgi:putative spermidine/putrescine transport system permease protein